MSHGFLGFAAVGRHGQRSLLCECGWLSRPDWPKSKPWMEQVEALRRHVIKSWKGTP